MEDRPPVAGGAGQRAKVFYGWWIVAVACVLSMVAGGTYWNGFSVYFLPVTRDLGLSRAATSLAYGLGRLEGGLEGPVAGYLVDRVGPRKMIVFSGIVAGAGFILLALTHSFGLFLLVYIGVLAVGMNSGFNHGTLAAVNQWFVRRKGLAMSIATLGSAIGGTVITPAVAYVVLTFGWRTAAVISGLAVIVVALPLSFLVRRSPESMGLLPDGDRPPAIAPVSPSAPGPLRPSGQRGAADFTTREGLRTKAFWLLALAMGLRVSAHTGVFVHMVPLMVWKGQTEAVGAFVVAFISFSTIPLRVLLGYMGDRWSKQRMVGFAMVLGAVSLTVLLFSGSDLWQLLVFAALYAFAEGVAGLSWSLLGDFFGRASFATLRGGVTMIHSFMSMGMPVFAGWVYDTTGSYYTSLIPMIVLYLLAAVTFWYLPKPRPPRRLAEALPTEAASAG